MKYILSISLVFVLFFATSCDEGFPTQDKPNVPTDHTDHKEGVFHKSGSEYPYAYDNLWQSSCAGASCHMSNLQGGLVMLDGKRHKSPSCYQCHGRLWHEIDSSFSKK